MTIIVQVEGFSEFRTALKQAAPELDKQLQKALRAAVGPIVSDAKARFNALPGTGPRTAKQVRSSVVKNGVAVTLSTSDGYELGREFGAKGYRLSHYDMKTRWGGTAHATRAFDYSKPKVFDTWTGNRFTLGSGVSGRAFYPAIAAGAEKAIEQVWTALGVVVDKLGN